MAAKTNRAEQLRWSKKLSLFLLVSVLVDGSDILSVLCIGTPAVAERGFGVARNNAGDSREHQTIKNRSKQSILVAE